MESLCFKKPVFIMVAGILAVMMLFMHVKLIMLERDTTTLIAWANALQKEIEEWKTQKLELIGKN
jgi:hypothetical protein